MRFPPYAALVAALFCLAPGTAFAQRGNWEELGTATIGTRLERDVIDVGRREGRFQTLMFEVRQNDVEIVDLKVIYGGGDAEDIQVRNFFKAGSRSRPIDLKGRGRFIRQIEVTYRARGPVQIVFFGEQGRGGPGGPGGPGDVGGRWDELGCQKVGFLTDRDVIRVGRREGRYSAIKLQVRGNKIRLIDLKVVYANGAPDTIPVRTIIPANSETRPLDLQGGRRAIDRIEMVYLSQFNFKGQATVCAYGRQ